MHVCLKAQISQSVRCNFSCSVAAFCLYLPLCHDRWLIHIL